MQKILVPFDGSESATRALRHAASLVRENPAVRLELLCVIDPMTMHTRAVSSDADLGDLQAQEAHKISQPARQLLDEAGVAYQVQSRVGSPANEIAEHVRESGCDAIVMGTRGMGPVATLMIGSVAMRVVHLVDVPVTLIK